MAIESKNLLVWVKAMSRGQALPLDASEIYTSMTEAEAYASSPIAYAGQTIKVLQDDGKYHEYILQPGSSGYVLEEVVGGSGIDIEIDETLSTQGASADAKAVGDALTSITQQLDDFVVDDKLSETSTHPVQNKIVSETFNTLVGATPVAQQIDSAVTVEQFTVELGKDGTLGGYGTGDVIEEGTDIKTILNKLLRKAVAATYTPPTIVVAAQSTKNGSYEYGTDITAKVQATFTQNDAGAIESITILKNGVEILTGTDNTLTSEAEEIRLTSTVSYTASASYKDGPVKTNNLKEPSPEGQITGSTITTSSPVKFTPYRQGYFYGVLATDKTVPLTSEIIRDCTKKDGAYAAGNMPLIRADSVDNRKRIFVACPATNNGITKVVMPSAQGADATKDFKKQESTVIVKGANDTTGIAYNVWVYEPDSISDDQTFTVTLG